MSTEPVDLLLVEDNDDDIVLIQDCFGQAKLINVLRVVKDGEEALAYLRRKGKYKNAQLPGLVLLDINMPKKSGFEVLEEIKADPQLRHLPVIMLTTSGREEDVLRSYRLNACSYIKKPVKFEQLQEVIKQFSFYWALVVRIPTNPSAH